jgi:hypothetical protein
MDEARQEQKTMCNFCYSTNGVFVEGMNGVKICKSCALECLLIFEEEERGYRIPMQWVSLTTSKET